MNVAPAAALDTLYGLDSLSVLSLKGRDRADYTLLMTEARYKCYLPIAGDTAISKASDYYRRHGPDGNLVRALMMEGAVLSERGDSEGAMTAFKAAEPVAGRVGDAEQSGLLNTRIGELYQRNIFNGQEAKVRFKEALKYFEKAGLEERTMFTHLSLASLYFETSADTAVCHLEKGLEIARKSGNRIGGITAYFQYLHHYCALGDSLAIQIACKFFSEYGDRPQAQTETSLYNMIYYDAAANCIELGMHAEAAELAAMMDPVTPVDSMCLFSIYSDLSLYDGNLRDAMRYNSESNSIYRRILVDDYENRILEVERRYDHAVLSENLRKSRNRVVTFSLLFVLALSLLSVMYFMFKSRARKRELMLAEAVREVQSLQSELQSKQQDTSKMNRELVSVSGDLLGILKSVADICYVYDGTSNMTDKIKSEVEGALSGDSLYAVMERMLEVTSPGFISGLEREFPSINERDRRLLVLVSCGFTTNTISVLLGTAPRSVNSRKYRLARKMGIEGRLSSYLKQTRDLTKI